MNKRVVCMAMTILLIFAMIGCKQNIDVNPMGETTHREDSEATAAPATEAATEPNKGEAGDNADTDTVVRATEPDVTPEPAPGSGASSGNNTSTATPPVQTAPPHQHSYSNSVTAPGCETGGYTVHTCACGDSYTDSYTNALGHSWGEWATTKEATTSSEGQEARTCGRCGATEIQTVAKLTETIDLWALEQYGRDYAVSAYGYEADTSMGKSNSGYYPGYSCWFTTMADGYSEVAECIDDTTSALIAAHGAISGETNGVVWRARLNLEVEDCGDGKYIIWVFYG